MFPVVLTAAAAGTADFVSQLRTCAASRFSLKKFSEAMDEQPRKQHGRDECQYLASVTEWYQILSGRSTTSYSRHTTILGATLAVSFRLGGAQLFLKHPYSAIMDRVIFAASGEWLAGDASYKVRSALPTFGATVTAADYQIIKRMFMQNGRPAGDGLHTMLNDLGQIRGMQLVLNKANTSIRPMLEGIARGLAEHGHAPT
jgi:hypothetical protein